MTVTSNPSNNRRAEADTMTTMKSSPVQIDIENLSLSFGNTEVLKGVNLAIRPGEFFAFLGPSGSGKSTLLRAIAGFGPTPKGQVKLDGQDIVGSVPWQRNVGMVFQSYALWPHMTVAKNVAFGLEERKVPASEIGPKVRAALELVGMGDYAERFPSQLSGGQQQRVALARTIVVEPRVLLLDEPLSNLDANLRVQMRQDLLKLQRRLGITTIFVTHDQEEANTICDRIAVMADGVVQQIGRPDEVYDNPANSFVAKFLGTANILEGEVVMSANGRSFDCGAGLLIAVGADEVPGKARLVVRPESIEFGSDDTKDTLSGLVASAEFLGGMVRYAIDVNGQELLVDERHTRGKKRMEKGENVALKLDPAQAVLIRD
ncbi:ABC transporter ATP-binding protein [Thalassospira sp.]|uniref:ABC transporter ATP-binding protein n=1 Tax=Rhodospirillales TaxID=204441 RepID=UPI00311E4D3F